MIFVGDNDLRTLFYKIMKNMNSKAAVLIIESDPDDATELKLKIEKLGLSVVGLTDNLMDALSLIKEPSTPSSSIGGGMASREIDQNLIQKWVEEQALVDHIFVKNNKNELSKLFVPNIQAIETEGNYCLIHTRDRKHVVKISLKKLKEQLSSRLFLQVHRNFMVQLSHVDSIDFSNNFLKIGSKKFPLGATYKQQLQKRITQLK